MGLTGFAFGFAFKDMLSNFISGVLIFIYEPFKIDDFIEEESLKILTVSPLIKYNFTSWVNGNLHFTYTLTEDKITGRTETKDIGFFLSFTIRG